ncbi:hypothetical protein VSH64_33850 [Amycolatopsis rhabdoformis]|uniref:Uncharacterized protein n=1 Tax=Amycolatopsis rhabdoformis TaxID=1448059 RepID=A0ABZ1I2C3_9PSEU|nr:hypothetical protein [Amycolatopsis rhabdoformis]WSE27805.1 hypothetical protein VSH64_33850 [Amycolatopsis rhabdoformis]
MDVWPLPTGPEVTVVFAWPARGVAELRVPYDLGELREVQRRVVDLFPA